MAVRRGRRRRGGTWIDGIGGVDLLVDWLRSVPSEARSDVRKAVIAATREMRADMAARASWSSRIPRAITTRTSFARGSVELRVDARRAPHARPYEGIGTRGGTFRHPVFGSAYDDRNGWTWVTQAARPFFFPTVDRHREKVRDAVETAVFKSLPR
jgi:hypothetical protein